ncbi:uncharacterized protein ZBAI_09237 [Zygosaccharomyces bailii ISA1307]|nr:uncharacterized protein ZBAI_09237 [Zygosaccharomyces bailii ISA1307]
MSDSSVSHLSSPDNTIRGNRERRQARRGGRPRGGRRHGKDETKISENRDAERPDKENQQRRQHNRKINESIQKGRNHSIENTADKDVTVKDRGGRRRNRQKNKLQQAGRKNDEMNVYEEKIKKDLTIEREEQVSQCLHLLTERNFKLFKRGQYVTSYGFTRNQKMFGTPNLKFIVNIPRDYPKSPIKLQYCRTNCIHSVLLVEKLDTLTRNFNSKSSKMVSEGVPIISQLNYLVQKADILCLTDYKVRDKREQNFYANFV